MVRGENQLMSHQARSGAPGNVSHEEDLSAVNRESFPPEGESTATPSLPFTGERIVPGLTEEPLFRWHQERYVFASRFVEDNQVLDVACGTGIGTHYLLKAGARSCLGLDTDSAAVEYARVTYKGCFFVRCDATNLCLPDCSVDVIVSFETIEHLGDQVKFLLECHRVLRPGGILISSTPNRRMTRWQHKNPYHTRELSAIEFKQLMQKKFVDVEIYAQDSKAYLPYVARALIARLLDQLELKNLTKRILRWKRVAISLKTEFDGTPGSSDSQIRRYRRGWRMQPLFVIAVGRRASH